MAATITPESVWAHIPPRARDSHKGSFGAVLVVAGSACYRGAASLAVEGALRTGAGIVTLASVEPVLAAVSARLPECCLCPCLAGAEGGISPRSLPNITRQKATTLLLGPGLGYTAQSAARAAETRELVEKLLPGFGGSAVLDADGLNAAASLLNAGRALPHPAGELDPDASPRGNVPAHGAFHFRPCGGPGRRCLPLCPGVERRGGAERGGDGSRRAGWPLLRQHHGQSGPFPGRQRGRSGRDDGGPAGLRSARLRSRRLCGLPPRSGCRPGRRPPGRIRDAPAGLVCPAGAAVCGAPPLKKTTEKQTLSFRPNCAILGAEQHKAGKGAFLLW